MSKFERVIWVLVALISLFFIIVWLILTITGKGDDCTTLACYIKIIGLIVGGIGITIVCFRIIKAYAEVPPIVFEAGLILGSLTASASKNPGDCEKCEELQKSVTEEVDKLKGKIPWWKALILAAAILALAAACAAATVLTLGGAIGCVVAVLGLIAGMFALAAEGEDVAKEKKKLEEKKKKLEEHQKEHEHE